MIRAENLVKRFGEFRALDDVSLEIEEGSIYGLVGSNGAGKSTLMRCVAGIYEPEEGPLSVGREPVYENPAVQAGMKRQAAFMLAMAARPQVVMLDECFDGLDPVKRQIVRKVICDAVAERKMTAVISSHNLKELDEICDTVGILHKGRLLYSKDLDSLKGEVHKVQAVFMQEVSREELEKVLPVMPMEVRGKFFTLIVRGSLEEMEVMGYDANVLFHD